MPDETPDPGATRAGAKKTAREPEPAPSPEPPPPPIPFDTAELEALRARLIAKFNGIHGRR